MSLRDYIRVFRRRWPIILACVLVAAGVTWLVSSDVDTSRQPTGYKATATLLVGAAPSPTGSPGQQVGGNLSRVALFVTTGEIPVRAAESLGVTEDPAVLASRIDVEADSAAGALKITASSSDSVRAAETANTFADETVRFYEGDRDGVRVSILQRATSMAVAPSGGFIVPPGKLPRSLIAGALGLLFGLALALIVNQLDSRLRTRDQVHKTLRMPVIAEVPRLSRKKTGGLTVLEEPLSPYADAYRSARTAITHLPSQRVEPQGQPAARGVWGDEAQVVLVTSGMPGEGKTTSVANLAASFAETGQSVLVLDGDLRKPDTHLLLDVPQAAGISNHLVNPEAHPLRSLMRPTKVPGVRMITAGTDLKAPTALVSRLESVIEGLRGEADVVIVDSVPLLAASDVFDLLPLVDTVMIVVRSGRLTDSAGERIAELLGRYNVPVIGAMLIGAPAGSDGYGYGYGRSYGYGRGYGYGQKKQGPAEPVEPAASSERAEPTASSPSRALPPSPETPADAADQDEPGSSHSELAPRSVWNG